MLPSESYIFKEKVRLNHWVFFYSTAVQFPETPSLDIAGTVVYQKTTDRGRYRSSILSLNEQERFFNVLAQSDYFASLIKISVTSEIQKLFQSKKRKIEAWLA